MEWVQGRNILDWLAEKNDVLYSLEKFVQFLDCLIFVHEENIIHRDIKSENIMYSARTRTDDCIWLCDWSLSKKEMNRNLTCLGEGFGTPGYASVDQLEDKKALEATKQDDIYSSGMVMWEFFYNKYIPAPLRSEGDGKESKKRGRYLEKMGSVLPEALQPIFYRATNVDREKRYKDITSFKRDLIIAIGKMTGGEKHKYLNIFDADKFFAIAKTELGEIKEEIEEIIDTDIPVSVDIEKLVKDKDNIEVIKNIMEVLGIMEVYDYEK